MPHVLFSTIQFFSFLCVIVSLINAGYNGEVTGGSRGLAFAAVWSALLVVAYAILGSITVYAPNGTDGFTIGNVIGMGAMLAQLYFVLMFAFYVDAQNKQQSDRSEFEKPL